MTCDLDVIDCFGRRVVLDHSNWQRHINSRRHLEVIPYHDRFPSVLIAPDIVVEATRDGDLHFYKKDIGVGKFSNAYLRLVVKRLGPPAPDKVASWWFSHDVLFRGTIVWPR